jgi:hypothetical protein
VKAGRRLLALLIWTLSGCAGGLAVRAPVQLPARIPVGVFPSIWVAGGSSADEQYLLDRLATDLAKDRRREVRRVDPTQLAAARAAAQVSPLTAVVTLQLMLRSGTRRTQATMPVQYCGMYGCTLQYQSYVEMVPELAGEVVLTVAEGPSGRTLQVDRSTETVIGDREDLMHGQLIERIALQLAHAVAITQAPERIELERTRHKQARAGVELLTRGKLAEGRAELERAARTLGGLDKQKQAAIWYDLGVARYVAPGPRGLTPQALADAERAFAWARRLSTDPRYARALERVAEARKRLAVIEQQERAAAHNFSLVTDG